MMNKVKHISLTSFIGKIPECQYYRLTLLKISIAGAGILPSQSGPTFKR